MYDYVITCMDILLCYLFWYVKAYIMYDYVIMCMDILLWYHFGMLMHICVYILDKKKIVCLSVSQISISVLNIGIWEHSGKSSLFLLCPLAGVKLPPYVHANVTYCMPR